MLKQEGKDGTSSAGRDLLTLLIKSNMVVESAGNNKDQTVSDEEVLGQISTFLAAGHETTSVSTTWALYALSKHPLAQSKLRQELLNAGLGDEPTMGELDKLPYLGAVLKETLRVFAPVPNVGREAAFDTVIPVGEPYKDRKGLLQTEIQIQKGDTILVPILPMNRAMEVWGEDATEFKPERWENLPQAVKEMPGNLTSFIEGIHACIGYRFAVIEIKTLLYSLIRSVAFDIDPTIEIEGKAILVTRPQVKSDPKKGSQMPLICKPLNP
ncbi:cytochrome P450 [Ceratobasidium sp. AG-I]|nr:cytochrome P450 [Ceratobasidium sp. AG-I]